MDDCRRDYQHMHGGGDSSMLGCSATQLPALPQQVEEALKERSQRIYKEYGNVMLDTEGMTKVCCLPLDISPIKQ